MRILVAEDHPLLLKNWVMLIEGLGHEAVPVKSAPGAIDLLRASTFDAVISDCDLFGGTGNDILAWVEENQPKLLRRFVFVTGNPGKVTAASCRVFLKPCDFDVVFSAIGAKP